MKRYPKILRVGSPRRDRTVEDMEGPVWLQEKLDGACMRFTVDDQGLLFGSKKMVWDDGDIGKQYRAAAQFIHDTVDDVPDDYVFFGEAMVLHNIDYDWDTVPPFVGFDVWSEEDETFISPEQAERMFSDMNLPFTPHLERWETPRPKEEIQDMQVPESIYRDGQAEGVVLKNPRTGIYAKVHAPDFKEHNELSFGHTKANAETDEQKLVAEYCSNQRIIKVLQKEVIENGRDLTMKDMMGEAQVHHRVLEDLWEEELGNIIHKRYKVDLYRVKKLVTKRTKKVLKRRINVKERNGLTGQEALSMMWDE